MTLPEMRLALTRPRHFRMPHMHDLAHRGEHVFHMGYMGLVSYEAHYKWYGKAALLCVLCMIIAQFLHEAQE